MQVAALITRMARRTLDVALLLLIAFVLVVLVLARALPMVTGGTTFVIGGPSMEPTLPVGSAVLAVPVKAAELAPGDIVSLQVGPQHTVFTHRVVRLAELPDGTYLQTKGDANDDNDPSLVPATAVIGRVALALPMAGYAIALLSSFQGVLFLVSLGLALLTGAWLLEVLEDDQRATARRPVPDGSAAHPEPVLGPRRAAS
jgi:signal peptidase I